MIRSLLIFGPPGAGKGTVAKALCVSGVLYHLSSGDVFRGLSPESEEGKLFYGYASKGHLVPDDVVVKICKRHIEGLVSSHAFRPEEQMLLLDGLPRTGPQVKMVGDFLDVRSVVVLEVSDEDVLIKRLSRRALIEGRKDDQDERVLQERMRVYREQTASVLDHYDEGLIRRVNADQGPLEVLKDVLEKVTPNL